jgi:hypothetical protein
MSKPESDKEETETETEEENIIREMSKCVISTLGLNNEFVGLFYKYIHFLFIFLIGFVAVFNNNIFHLIIILIIISLDALSVVILHECPLTKLEQKYLNTNSCDERSNHFKKAGIVYKCEHEYEKQIELLINAWLIIALKCMLIIFLRTFNFKLQNYSNIY